MVSRSLSPLPPRTTSAEFGAGSGIVTASGGDAGGKQLFESPKAGSGPGPRRMQRSASDGSAVGLDIPDKRALPVCMGWGWGWGAGVEPVVVSCGVVGGFVCGVVGGGLCQVGSE